MNDIWYMLQDAERYVYHYTPARTLAEHILPDEELLFSRFEKLNDPRESKNWVFHYHLDANDLEITEQQKIEAELNARLKHMWRIGCFVSDVENALVTREREDRGEDIVGAAYERGHSHPRMWAQYGDCYKGACLVFDKNRLDFDVRSTAKANKLAVYAERVTYRNPDVLPTLGRPDELYIFVDRLIQLGIDQYVTEHVQNFWRELFFVKARDWTQEREFRWLVQGHKDEDFFVPIKDSLVGILLGDRFPNHHKSVVSNYALAKDVSIAIMSWQNGFPQPMPSHPNLLTV